MNTVLRMIIKEKSFTNDRYRIYKTKRIIVDGLVEKGKCPGDVGLKEFINCAPHVDCYKCWEKAVT